MARRETGNRDSDILILVALDWVSAPMTVIQKELPYCARQTLNLYRESDVYKLAMEGLRDCFRKNSLEQPSTLELRKSINALFSTTIKRLWEIMTAPNTSTKDLIGGARLVAQIDGRFLRDKPDDDPLGQHQESIADELVEALKRVNKQSVQ